MRVMYLCAKHPLYDGRIHYKISPCLIKKGYDVVNIHPNINNSEDAGIKLLGYIQKGGFRGRLNSLKSLYKTGKDQNPDVIIAPEPDSLVVAYLIKRHSKNLKVIFDCHEWYNVHFTHVVKMKNIILAKILNGLISFIMKYISKRIEAVITVNDTMTDYFKRYNKNSHTIPSLMAQSFKPDMHCERKDYIYFGQFGNGGQEEVLLDAARYLKNKKSSARIIIIGGYHPKEAALINEFVRKIEEEKLSRNIQFKGWLPKEESFSLLSSGLVGIMRFDTSYYNGLPALPNKIFEYMASGMAVICCGMNVELKKIVETEKCGIVIERENGEDLAKAILYLNEHHDRCLKMGENAYNATLLKYNWNKYGDILEGIIKCDNSLTIN